MSSWQNRAFISSVNWQAIWGKCLWHISVNTHTLLWGLCLASVKPNFVTFRRLMIEKIAAHLADFTPRLQSNTRALYQYCPIPVINYPQLENELFCNIYYLKHLCDTLRFPDWPIKDPVSKKNFRICSAVVLSES